MKTRPHPRVSETIVKQEEDAVKAIPARPQTTDTAAAIRHEMGVTMDEGFGVFRHKEGMTLAQRTVAELRDRWTRVAVQDKGRIFNTGLVRALELGFMLDCAETIALGALTRQESRGAHFRTDYLQRDDDRWLRHILIYHDPDGPPRIDFLPVRITQWEPQIRVY